jgi:GT2 family glycosyltransferase
VWGECAVLNIHCVVIAYGLVDDLFKLFELTAAPNVHYHLFTHSDIPPVLDACGKLIADYPNSTLYDYRTNRGLAKSWNEGLEAAYANGADVAMLLNDDMLPMPGDLQRVAQTAYEMPDAAIVKCRGMDLRTKQYTTMEFGFTAITPRGLDRVGYFDENITPIFWEDIDWDRRRYLLGELEVIEERTGVVHAGSKTTVIVPGLLEFGQQSYDRNRDYYCQKWNGTHLTGEKFLTPFNDPTLGLKITAEMRSNPYPNYTREMATDE